MEKRSKRGAACPIGKNFNRKAQRSQRNAEPCLWEDRKFGKPMELRNGGVRVDHPGIPCASGTCSYAAPNAKSGAGGEVLRNKNSHQRNLVRAAWRDTLTSNGSRSEIRNPHFPALRSDPMALSGASRRKQTPSSRIKNHSSPEPVAQSTLCAHFYNDAEWLTLVCHGGDRIIALVTARCGGVPPGGVFRGRCGGGNLGRSSG